MGDIPGIVKVDVKTWGDLSDTLNAGGSVRSFPKSHESMKSRGKL